MSSNYIKKSSGSIVESDDFHVKYSAELYKGGYSPYSVPSVLSAGCLANTGLWRLKSAIWYAPHLWFYICPHDCGIPIFFLIY